MKPESIRVARHEWVLRDIGVQSYQWSCLLWLNLRAMPISYEKTPGCDQARIFNPCAFGGLCRRNDFYASGDGRAVASAGDFIGKGRTHRLPVAGARPFRADRTL